MRDRARLPTRSDPCTSTIWPSTRSDRGALMAIDVAAYRAEFPVLEKKAYLISASLGPVSTRAKRNIDEDTALVIVNRVMYRTSALLDAKEVCRFARKAGAWTVVDDFHGAGIVPVDVHDLGCDFYTTGVLKWLCGGPGLTFLYARRSLLPSLHPAITGWFATAEPFSFDLQHWDLHRSARRLEHGTPAAPVAFIAQGGLDGITEVGPANTRERQQDLIDYVIARADEAGLPVRSPRDRQRRGGMVNVGVGQDAEKVCHSL